MNISDVDLKFIITDGSDVLELGKIENLSFSNGDIYNVTVDMLKSRISAILNNDTLLQVIKMIGEYL